MTQPVVIDDRDNVVDWLSRLAVDKVTSSSTGRNRMDYTSTPESKVASKPSIIIAHENLDAQLSALAEDITKLEERILPVLSPSLRGEVRDRDVQFSSSELHDRATKMTEIVIYLRSRIDEIIERVEL